MQDITEQKNLHEELKEKTRALRNQYELARQAESVRNVSTWQWNPNGNKVFWSENLFRILGYSPYSFEPTFETFLAMVHPDDRKIVLDALEAIRQMDSGALPLLEYRVFDKHGNIKYLHSSGRVSSNSSGKYVTGTVNDVTENILMKHQLSRNEQLFQTIIDADTKAISIYDEELKCTFWNKRSSEIHGTSTEEALGKNLFDLIPLLKQENIVGTIQRIINDERLVVADRHSIELDNMTFEISPVVTTPMKNADCCYCTTTPHLITFSVLIIGNNKLFKPERHAG